MYLLFIPVFAFAAKGALIDNLCYSGAYNWDWPFSTIGGEYSRWVAFDYNPDSTYVIDEVKMDWVYYLNIVNRGDMNFGIYLGNVEDPPIISFTIPEADYTESDTGFDYYGHHVYRGEIPLGDEAFNVSPGNTYWIALQIDSENNVFSAGWEHIVGEPGWSYEEEYGWAGYYDECSYALYDSSVGIKSSSLGEIKASFR